MAVEVVVSNGMIYGRLVGGDGSKTWGIIEGRSLKRVKEYMRKNQHFMIHTDGSREYTEPIMVPVEDWQKI